VVAQAQAEEQLARSNLERAQTLAGSRAISQQELDRLASELAVRSAFLRVQEATLAKRRVEAAFDGVVGPRRVSPGQYVDAGTQLGTLVDDATVKIRCAIPERGLARVRLGQEARLRVNAYPDRPFRARVELIHPEVDETTRTGEVRLVADNPEGLLRPGMFARVEIVVDAREDALVIPEEALIASLDAFSVYAVVEGRARLRPVTVGVRMPGRVEVLAGLDPDTEVVLRGIQKVLDGVRVTSGL
jgi:membrane fusion protein (multidrug efflux system)